ncbi:hypothetical protein C1H46_004612 [Malus baccata]|uniref:Uncharacterized protein n=1 Tax=Malus baccata TaxID=106549 RepID=A0A540NFN4_MALBA|nr:hypothetical protein C1H46_004612 [Malus baccata]
MKTLTKTAPPGGGGEGRKRNWQRREKEEKTGGGREKGRPTPAEARVDAREGGQDEDPHQDGAAGGEEALTK